MITKIGGPTDNINPAYNPLVYYFDSTNKTNPGFRYIVEVFDALSNDKIFEKTIIPDIDNNYCVLNLNREMSDFISYDFDLDELDQDNYRADNSYYRFDIKIGEEYLVEWEFDDFGFAGSGNWPNYSDPQYNGPSITSRTMLFNTNPSVQPPYQNGDTILVELSAGTQDRPSISGVHKVLDVYQQSSGGVEWVVVLGIPWVGSGVSTGGNVKLSTLNKTRFPNLLSLTDESVFNTVLKVDDFLNYDATVYNMTGSTGDKLFLTQIPNNYEVRENNTMFLQYMSYKDSTIGTPRTAYFQNDSGDASELALTTGVNTGVWGLDVSPTRTNWGTVATGTLPIVKPETLNYSVTLLDVNGFAISETKTIVIDYDCDIAESTMEMVFMDKFGSFIPYNFTARNVEKQNITRDNLTKYLGGLNTTTNKFDYNLTDGGTETYNADYKRMYDLSTDYMNDTDSVFFQNVLHSPVTFLKIDGQFVRCVINTNTVTIKKDNWSERIRYNMSVEISHAENINI